VCLVSYGTGGWSEISNKEDLRPIPASTQSSDPRRSVLRLGVQTRSGRLAGWPATSAAANCSSRADLGHAALGFAKLLVEQGQVGIIRDAGVAPDVAANFATPHAGHGVIKPGTRPHDQGRLAG
jgi:hypothetical protein